MTRLLMQSRCITRCAVVCEPAPDFIRTVDSWLEASFLHELSPGTEITLPLPRVDPAHPPINHNIFLMRQRHELLRTSTWTSPTRVDSLFALTNLSLFSRILLRSAPPSDVFLLRGCA